MAEIHLLMRVREGAPFAQTEVVADPSHHADAAEWPVSSAVAPTGDVATTALVGWLDMMQQLYSEWDCERDDAEANNEPTPACPAHLRALRDMAEQGGTITVTRVAVPNLRIVP